MIPLKRAIETPSQFDVFDKLVHDNPLYLINMSGNFMPSIVFTGALCMCVSCVCKYYSFHSGSRYNALHIACRVGNINVVRRVLELINDHNFIAQLQPANTPNRDAMNAGLFVCLYSKRNMFMHV
jgi:hypothetical protein